MTDPIDYAPPDTHARWKPRKRHVAALILFALALVAAYRWPDIVRYYAVTQAWVWQRRCLTHTMPVDAVVYAEDYSTVSRLAGRNGYARSAAMTSIIYRADALTQFLAWRRRAGYYTPWFEHGGTAFLQERRSGDRSPLCIVTVTPFAPNRNTQRYLALTGAQVPKAGPTGDESARIALHAEVSIPLQPNDRFSLYAGQADSSDASKFSLRYELNGVEGFIEGQLQPDGRLTLTPPEVLRAAIGHGGVRLGF